MCFQEGLENLSEPQFYLNKRNAKIGISKIVIKDQIILN